MVDPRLLTLNINLLVLVITRHPPHIIAMHQLLATTPGTVAFSVVARVRTRIVTAMLLAIIITTRIVNTRQCIDVARMLNLTIMVGRPLIIALHLHLSLAATTVAVAVTGVATAGTGMCIVNGFVIHALAVLAISVITARFVVLIITTTTTIIHVHHTRELLARA